MTVFIPLAVERDAQAILAKLNDLLDANREPRGRPDTETGQIWPLSRVGKTNECAILLFDEDIRLSSQEALGSSGDINIFESKLQRCEG
ncbi:hypothetical protein HL653_16700 [Sphingomonas sp. AP4-R1]|uniref:hypothetical protein n=1 Tax=Sphingomonas sp. AP4-R1 TaxID=2735134 RepID=UPI0014938638|nr:hypothetical protein [Sphingomonas sp. AP4-R1]QJU59183.1 hypothetical protein HL653_16700 [Sphingomonas sp. AP4-R1]